MKDKKSKKSKIGITGFAGGLQKVIYFLCFIVMIVSMIAVVLAVKEITYYVTVLYCLVALDFAIIVMHKIYTYLIELSLLKTTVNRKLRENSFIAHDNFFSSVSDEISLFCRIIFVLLTVSMIGYGFALGDLSISMSLCIVLVVVILKIKSIVFFTVAGKIFDHAPKNRQHDVPRGQYKVFRGYAKLFMHEYQYTEFKSKDKFYRERMYADYNFRDQRQAVSIKSILFFEVKYQIKHEKHKLIAIIVMFLCAFLLVFYSSTDAYILKMLYYFRLDVLSSYPIRVILIFVLNTIICLVSATTLLHYQYSCSYIKKLITGMSSKDADELKISFLMINTRKKDYNRIRTLGLMTVCADKGFSDWPYSMDEIHNRPLFRHQLITSNKEFLLFTGAFIVPFGVFLTSLVDFTTLLGLIGSVLLAALLLHFIGMPCTKKMVIKRWCLKLSMNEWGENQYEISHQKMA